VGNGAVEKFSVLFVCTGNICRSPTAERLLRHALRERLGEQASSFDVTSAGVGALVDEPIQPHAAALLTGRGVDVEGFAARQLDAALLTETDLLLAMTREHRAAAATQAPQVVPRLFTLREFARLAAASADQVGDDADPVERARQLVKAAAGMRGLARPGKPSDDDVPDPYGRPADAYRLPFALIGEAVDVVADLLAGPRLHGSATTN
jgi:protein-tyrosine phosphatase